MGFLPCDGCINRYTDQAELDFRCRIYMGLGDREKFSAPGSSV